MEVTRRRGRRRKKLLDDLKGRRGYSHLKEEALDRTVWRNCFGGGFGPVVRQNTEWMNVWKLVTRLHGVASHKAVILTFTAVKNLTSYYKPLLRRFVLKSGFASGKETVSASCTSLTAVVLRTVATAGHDVAVVRALCCAFQIVTSERTQCP